MKYHLLISDIDGTLRPGLLPQIPFPNVEAVRAVQQYGVCFVIATGRARSGIPDEMLNGLQPDYWICAAGAQVLDRDGNTLVASRMELKQLEALTEFCRKEDYPLTFSFSDSSYAYSGYNRLCRWAKEIAIPLSVRNGEARNQHYLEMPFSASAQMPLQAAEQFQQQHGELGLRFVYYGDNSCDILRPGQDKALGLSMLLKHIGLGVEECVSVGDSNNDVDILRTVGLSFCVEGGEPAALAAADQVCPSSADCGVAAVCRMIWPEALSG